MEHTVQRIRNLEHVLGRDPTFIKQGVEWQAQMEAHFRQLLNDHDQFWQTTENELDKRLGDVQYRKIVQTAELLPMDVALSIFSEFSYPEGVPLVFSPEVPPAKDRDPTAHVKEMSNEELKKVSDQ